MKLYPLILLLLLASVASGQLKLNVTITKSDCGMNNGSISAVASGGTPPYEYAMNGGLISTNGNFTSLKPAEYQVSTRDAAGTIVSQQFFITDTSIPPVPTFITKDPSNCDKFDGRLTIVMSGGTPPFTYSLDNITYQSSNIFNNLTHGIYNVYVKDANGCRNTQGYQANMFAPNCGAIRLSGNTANCGNNGRISVVDPLPGIAPRQYSLDGINYQDSPTFTNLAPGVMTIRIKDATGFVRLFSYEMFYYCIMQLSLTTTAPGCDNTGGSITAVQLKGEAPFQYSINDGPYQASNRFDLQKAGTYVVKVRDARGLTVSMSATLVSTCPIVTTKGATCGLPNGEIEVTGSGGTAPYTYSMDGANYQVLNRFAGLAAQTYTVYVKDAAGIVTTANALVGGQPAPAVSGMVTAASCTGNDGSITAVNASGTSPLVYSITAANFQSSPVFGKLASGNYTLIVKDGNGCTNTVDLIVPFTNSLQVSLDKQITICEGKIATLNVNSNASVFQWAGAGITNPGLRDQNVAPLVTTQYILTSTTGNCSRSDTIVVTVKPAPHADAGKDQSICFGEDAQLEGSGGLTFNWTPAGRLTDSHIANPISKKPAATLEYALTVTDATGCSSRQPDLVMITVTTPKVFAGNDTSVLANQPFNLKAVDVNNSGLIQYTWQPPAGLTNPDIANPVAVLDKSTTYRVTAKTASGCEGSDEVTVKTFQAAEIYMPNAFTPNGDGHNDFARPILVGIKELANFTIYNRWGGILYRSTPGSDGWDGRINGVLQSAAVFTWIAVGIDFQGIKIKKHGTIMLIR